MKIALATIAFLPMIAVQNVADARNAPVQRRSVFVTADTVILVGRAQPAPVLRAAEDLAGDMARVFGRRPRLVRDPTAAGPVTIVVGNDIPGIPTDRSRSREAFSIATGPAILGSHASQVVRLSGADVRGTIFAIYQFSETRLGVDPMYLWTDALPARRTGVELPARSYVQYPSPTFRYRGFFINDEDQLTGWSPGPRGEGTGISLAAWDRVFETILRLKGNLVVPGTWPFAGEPQMRAASDRGLILSQHHAEPLGVNFSRWPKDAPYDYTTQPELLRYAWTSAAKTYAADQEVLWTVGLRGLSDMPYADFDPRVRGDPVAQAKLVSRAIADQVAIVRKTRPNDEFITQLWSEGAELMRSGALTLPKGVAPIWADTGYGDLQDKGRVSAGQGAYLHVAMLNDHANQLSELVPVETLFADLSRYQTAGATQLVLLNTSDIRAVAMGARATMDAAWAGGAVGSSGAWLRRFAAREFGEGVADRVVGLYQDYYAAPALTADTRKPSGDQYYHNRARQMLVASMTDYPTAKLLDQAPKWLPPRLLGPAFDPDRTLPDARADMAACAEASSRWDELWKRAKALAPDVAPARRDYYQAQVLTMIAVNRESNLMLEDTARAVSLLANDDRSGAAVQADAAIAALDRLRGEMDKAEYGEWRGWYRGDWITGVARTRAMLVTWAAWARDPAAPILPPMMWSNWEASYHIQHYQGDRTVGVH